MSARNAVLALGTLLVLGLGVYLLVAVRAEPATPPAAAPPATAERSAPPPPPPPASPAGARSAPPAASGGAPSWVPARPGTPAGTAAPAPVAATADPAAADADLSGPRLDLVMDEANKAYDRGDYDDAKTVAARVLARQPSNVRMLRIMVSASCIDGDSATATASYLKLPAPDQAQMRTRCQRYGVAFPEN